MASKDKQDSIALYIEEIRPKFEFDNTTAAAYLNISPKALARLRGLELIQAIKIGAYWFYKREWLDDYLDSVTIRRAE